MWFTSQRAGGRYQGSGFSRAVTRVTTATLVSDKMKQTFLLEVSQELLSRKQDQPHLEQNRTSWPPCPCVTLVVINAGIFGPC